ncbi:hypothetical protein SD81_038830 [Tolypothrix campylonemoides VB511288]|nr:hypothetical protein SD81_038830 [Tolypothrix campylonemoides VB511288]
MTMLRTLRLALDSPLAGAGAALAYGGWALLANLDGGVDAAVRAGLLHGAISAALTFVGVRLVATVHRRVCHAGLAALGALVVTYAASVGLHLALHTPHVLLTLLPGLLPTVGFTAGYALLVARTSPCDARVRA